MVDTSQVICDRADLVESVGGGKAVRFMMQRGTQNSKNSQNSQNSQKLPCFVVAFGGEIYAYVNKCPHRYTELDWLPGEVFDDEGLYLICATHGAVFEVNSGLCTDGPCKGLSLDRVQVREVDKHVILVDGLLLREDETEGGDRY